MRWFASFVLASVAACGFEVQSQPGATPDEVDAAMPQIDTPATVFDAAKCPPSYVAVSGLPHRYTWGPALVATGLLIGWQTAQSRCAAMATTNEHVPHLVVFDEPNERQAVWAAIGGSLGYQWIWSGLFETPGGWASITGSPVTPEWAQLEPMDRAGTQTTKRAIAFGGNANRPAGDLKLPLDWSENAACECDGRDVIAMP